MTGSQPGALWGDYAIGRNTDMDDMLHAAAICAGLPLHLVIGDGFDQRTLHIVRRCLTLGIDFRVTTMALPPGVGHGASTSLARANRKALAELGDEHGFVTYLAPEPTGADPLTVGARQARALIAEEILKVGEAVVLDVSAMPTRRFFPLIGAIEAQVREHNAGEFLITVAENPELDQMIRSEGTTEPGAIVGFRHTLGIDAADVNTIWAPVLGESSEAELRAIYEYLGPDEVYPILPFPARDPRRADGLILEHRVLLFDVFETDKRNLLYVQEANPFDCYRVLTGLYLRSSDLLAPLGEVRVIVSVHASKMLSIGACLASIEQPIAVVTASGSHHLAEAPEDRWVLETTDMTAIWLQGSPYRA
ncbi:hypothetical protein [Candidatus Poriferisodalis sp.]|uniref:hypothetical protein n=1 Tax=Candidatus Poriferisodalis sp. TaxID=3101277 RepID=UPI003B02A1D1